MHSKLDYIQSLGFDSIWLSPIYEVNSIALGDDVIDFLNIDEKLGTQDDFDKLLDAIHTLGKHYFEIQIF